MVNERIAYVPARFESGGQAFICECAHTGCTERIRLPLDAYERVRTDPNLFLVLKGHEDTDFESVVEDLGAALIVQTGLEDIGELALAPA